MKNFLFGRKDSAPVWAPLLIRLALGIIFMAHGSQKVFGAFGGPGIEGVVGMVKSMGFAPPVLWAWMLALTEFLGGLAILVGLLTRFASVAIVIAMLVAVAKVHFRNGLFLPTGFEYNLALTAMALSLIASGAGKISLDWLANRWLKSRSR